MSKFNITPIAGSKNRVFVESTVGQEKKTSSGLIMVEKVATGQTEGKVIAVSEIDENGAAPQIAIGDQVFFSEHCYTENEYKGQKYLSMRESDITGKL